MIEMNVQVYKLTSQIKKVIISPFNKAGMIDWMTQEVWENDCAKFKREIRNQMKEYRKGRDKRRGSNLMLKHDQMYEAQINYIHIDKIKFCSF